MEIFNFSIARVAFNGNTQPYIVRSDKEAEECNDFIKSDGCEIVEIKHENKEEFKYIYATDLEWTTTKLTSNAYGRLVEIIINHLCISAFTPIGIIKSEKTFGN